MAKVDGKSTDSAIKPCRCVHAAQDSFYGKGNRLHTWGSKRHGKGPGYVCTVCLDFKSGAA